MSTCKGNLHHFSHFSKRHHWVIAAQTLLLHGKYLAANDKEQGSKWEAGQTLGCYHERQEQPGDAGMHTATEAAPSTLWAPRPGSSSCFRGRSSVIPGNTQRNIHKGISLKRMQPLSKEPQQGVAVAASQPSASDLCFTRHPYLSPE